MEWFDYSHMEERIVTDRYGRTIPGRESTLDKTFRRSPGSPSLGLMEESP